jgi:hypothetical protein
MEPIKLSFEYTVADYQEFLLNYFWKNQSRLYLLLLLFVFVVLFFTFKGSFLSLEFLLSSILPVTMMIALWWGIMRFSGRRSFDMNAQMQEPRSGQIDGEKITIAGQTFSSDFLWAGVQHVEETRNLFLVYNSKASAVMLPKRAFSSTQIQDFKRIVSEIPGLSAAWMSK